MKDIVERRRSSRTVAFNMPSSRSSFSQAITPLRVPSNMTAQSSSPLTQHTEAVCADMPEDKAEMRVSIFEENGCDVTLTDGNVLNDTVVV